MATLRRMLSSIVIITLAVWLILSVFVYSMQTSLVYFPMRDLEFTPAAYYLAHEDVLLDTADGETIHGWWVERAGARGVLLFLHGNGGNISHRLDSIRLFHDLGLSVLIVDYRGYGKSSGRPGESGTYRDAEAAWKYLVDARGIDPGRIVIYGESLGGAVATWLASRVDCGALLVTAGFTSVEDMGRHYYPYLPVRWLVRIRYPSIDYIADSRCPVLVMHSPADEIVPFDMGRRLFEAARPPKEFLELAGGHNDGFMLSSERVLDTTNRFLAAHLPR
jgi:fermentation-respiration switch protein FrsA (DUF1100 family)